jgi:hypothetical protein
MLYFNIVNKTPLDIQVDGCYSMSLYWCFDMIQSWAVIRVSIFTKVSEISIVYSNILNTDICFVLYMICVKKLSKTLFVCILFQFLLLLQIYGGLGGIVSIATCCGLDSLGIKSW